MARSVAKQFLNWIAMPYFELKTHRIGRTYTQPHFFILNKGLNSGKSLSNPCPNCFVVTTSSKYEKNILFHLSMMLQIGGFYAYYLKGSVIPFISIDDCRNTLKKGLESSESNGVELQKYIKMIEVINRKELEFQSIIDKMADLKVAYIHNCFKITQKNEK